MYIQEINFFPGRNIYSHNPSIQMIINLQDWAEVTTEQISSFKDNIVTRLPGLKEHYCSRGRPGGFIERLEEGTYLGHVIEHTAIELQQRVGHVTNYGKTRSTDDPFVYNIIFNYRVKEVGLAAGILAVELVESILENKSIDLDKKLDELKEISKKYNYGPSTKSIIRAAKKRNIQVIPLKEGTSFLQLGTGKHQKRIMATTSCQTSSIAVDLAGDKLLCKEMLEQEEIPVPPGAAVYTVEEAGQQADIIGYPVAVKPYNGNHGRGVTVDIREPGELRDAFEEACKYSSKVIIEKYLRGRNYRLLIIDGKMVAASERVPPYVTGDGEKSISRLIQELNNDPLRGDDHEKPLTKIKIDSHVLNVLSKQNIDISFIPSSGEKVWLRENANLSTGGKALDVTDLVHPDNIFIAERTAGILGLDIAGLDIVSEDISAPLKENGGAVIEVNAAPGIRMHEYPSQGEPRDAGGAIVDMLFPQGARSQVPVISITGTNGKTTVSRMINYMLKKKGIKTGMTTSEGIFINDRCIIDGDTTGPLSAQTVLRNPMVEAAVLETARGGIIRRGLGYDLSDIAVITNISCDHLGQDGINSLEDLLYVKSLVAEAVKPHGNVVLNVDDDNIIELSRWVKSSIIYFSKKDNSIKLKRHLAGGGKAVFIRDNSIYIAEGNKSKFVIRVKDVPLTLKGKAGHHIENALAVTAAGTAYGLSTEEIAAALNKFSLSLMDNPGRGNIFDYGMFKVIVDYGHNEAGFLSVAEMARNIGADRLVGIIGVPEDRSDDLIRKAGIAAGKSFNHIYIKEDMVPRVREPGEVASLLEKGVKEVGKDIEVEIILDETQALNIALQRVEEGDSIVIFYEKLEPVLEVLENLAKESKEPVISRTKKLLAGRAI